MKNISVPMARQQDLVIQDLVDEVLVYDLRINKAFCLNRSSYEVWKLCNGKRSAKRIAADLRYKEPVTEEFVLIALDQLEKEGLLEQSNKNFALIDKTSRRAMIKKAGLATAMALPLITSIVAPSAINAQSTACGPGLTFCPAQGPFGFPYPAGCYDLINGFQGSYPPGIEGCQFCNTVCTFGYSCVGGMCLINP